MWELAAIDFNSPTLLGVAAVMTAVGGIASTIMAIRKGRSEEEQQLVERLKETRAEAERLAKELHDIKMRDTDAEK